ACCLGYVLGQIIIPS
ncbi:transporter, anaerobic C4-dicarboxylate uptake family protein, partial [Vibrio parahaemolyticus IDH02640]